MAFDAQLAAGRLHEWFVDSSPSCDEDHEGGDVPFCLFCDVARRALVSGAFSHVAWVGMDALPYPSHLGTAACRASVVVDVPPARDPAERVWAIDVLARSATPVAVFARVERLTLAHTRRLQLAAASGRGVCLVARPARERQSLSAAATRWRVEPAPSSSARPRWTVTRLRDKDQPGLTDERAAWIVELNGASGLVHLPPMARDGSPAVPGAGARAAS